ncbi:hypothetical protein ACFCV3_39665 [Kribbella sp. NPDC056345]|uniref:hypothetical protein n=1 Tax=Kribbella sp. NPDC056345 TaxID=3345789 RepID=UPI0035D6C609
MPTWLLLFTVVGIISGHLFNYLRYFHYLRTVRHLADKFGLEALQVSSAFAPTSPERSTNVLDLIGQYRQPDPGEAEH